MKNQYSFRLLKSIGPDDMSVPVGYVLNRKNEDGKPFYPDFTQPMSVVLQTGDGKLFENTKATAKDGMLTFTYRGLIDDELKSEEHLKRDWNVGTLCYCSILGIDTLDAGGDNTWTGDQTFEGGIDAVNGVKIPTFESEEDADKALEDKFDGLIVMISGVLKYWSEGQQAWLGFGGGGDGGVAEIPYANTKNAGIVKIATPEDKRKGKIKSDAGVYNVPTVQDIVSDYIGDTYICGDKIEMDKTVYLHQRPTYAEATKMLNFGESEEHKELEVQAISNGGIIRTLEFKLDYAGEPSIPLEASIYVAKDTGDFFEKEGEVLATAIVQRTSVSKTGMTTINFGKDVVIDRGSPIIISFSLKDKEINTVNYYKLGVDSKRFGNVFSSKYVGGERIYENACYAGGGVEPYVLMVKESGMKFISGKDGGDKKMRYSDTGTFNQNSKSTLKTFHLIPPSADLSQPVKVRGRIRVKAWGTYDDQEFSFTQEPNYLEFLGETSNKGQSVGTFSLVVSVNKQITKSEQELVLHRWKGARLSKLWREDPYGSFLEWDLKVEYTDKNDYGNPTTMHLRSGGERMQYVATTVLGRHVDGKYVYPDSSGNITIFSPDNDVMKPEFMTEDKKFYRRLQGEDTWKLLGDGYAFLGKSGPRGEKGDKGDMGIGFKFRGKKNGVSELPATGEEGEAYTIGNDLYAWDGIKFSFVATVGDFNLVLDWDNIENKPDYEKLSDRVAYEISQGNYDFLFRITEGLYKQLNLLDTSLEIVGGENFGEIFTDEFVKDILDKKIFNDYCVNSLYFWQNISDKMRDKIFDDKLIIASLVKNKTAREGFGYNLPDDNMFTLNGDMIAGYRNDGPKANLVIPSIINGVEVRGIKENAFSSKQLTGKLYIYKGIKSLGREAFYMNGITSVIFPDTLEHIGESAFYMNKLKKVFLPDSITQLGVASFATNEIEELHIGKGITYIGESTFLQNKLKEVIIPSTVSTIGERAFEQNNLFYVVLNEGLRIIGRNAFNTNSLKTIGIPDSTTNIGKNAFIKNVKTSDNNWGNIIGYRKKVGEISVDGEAFISVVKGIAPTPESPFGFFIDQKMINTYDTNLGGTDIVIPSKIDGIDVEDIRGLGGKGLTSVVIPEGIKKIGGFCFSDNQLTSVIIPNSVVDFEHYAFHKNKLSSVIIGSGIEAIPDSCFNYNKITAINIPDTVVKIGSSSFDNNSATGEFPRANVKGYRPSGTEGLTNTYNSKIDIIEGVMPE